MKKRPVIGLLCITLVNQPEYVELDLELEQKIIDLGIDLIAFTPYGIRWSDKTVRGKGLVDGQWIQTEIPLPNAIYNRLYGTHPNTIRLLGETIGFESVFNRTNRLDKHQVYQELFSTYKQVLPFTTEYSWDGLMNSLDSYNEVVLKPKLGHYGLDIYRVCKTREGSYLIYQDKLKQVSHRLTKNKLKIFIEEIQGKAGEKGYLIQQLIEAATWRNRYFDIRTLVQRDSVGKWQVTAMVSRVAQKNYFVTNVVSRIMEPEDLLPEIDFEDSRTIDSNNILETISSLALQIASTLANKIGPFGELGMDFLLDRWGKPWLIEINGKPTKDAFIIIDDEETKEKVYLRPLEYAKFLASN